jgi:hypothetical protein
LCFRVDIHNLKQIAHFLTLTNEHEEGNEHEHENGKEGETTRSRDVNNKGNEKVNGQ